MKLKIWSKKAAEAEKNKDQLFLRLVYSEHSKEDIKIVIVDINGKIIERGSILYLDNDLKCLVKVSSVSEKAPLKTDLRREVFCIDENEAKRLFGTPGTFLTEVLRGSI